MSNAFAVFANHRTNRVHTSNIGHGCEQNAADPRFKKKPQGYSDAGYRED